jgi:hypothetical protein
MSVKTITILGINPGTKYLAITLFRGSELREWSMKTFKGGWSETKMEKMLMIISDLASRYEADVLVIKRLHPSRSSKNLDHLVGEIMGRANAAHIRIHEYSIKELEQHFSPGERMNKRKLAEKVVMEYPILWNELEQEKRHKNSYYTRLFEAVALGSVCLDHLDRT